MVDDIEQLAAELTDEEMAVLEEEMLKMKAAADAQLEALGLSVVKMRDEAIKGREASGIEIDWHQDEDAYEGVDDANRDDELRGSRRKPASVDGQFGRKNRETNRSTVLMNITRPYVDGASARVGDMLLPTDDRPWQLKLTPMPDIQAHTPEQMLAMEQITNTS